MGVAMIIWKPNFSKMFIEIAVAKYWHPTRNQPLTPADVTLGLHTMIWWRCFKSANHIWQAKVYIMVLARKQGRSGCPFCLKEKSQERSSLARKYPKVAQQWHPELNLPMTPEQVMSGSNKKYWWVCAIDPEHVWQAPVNNVVNSRARSTKGCPFCHHAR
jgi:hypothetical protein